MNLLLHDNLSAVLKIKTIMIQDKEKLVNFENSNCTYLENKNSHSGSSISQVQSFKP